MPGGYPDATKPDVESVLSSVTQPRLLDLSRILVLLLAHLGRPRLGSRVRSRGNLGSGFRWSWASWGGKNCARPVANMV